MHKTNETAEQICCRLANSELEGGEAEGCKDEVEGDEDEKGEVPLDDEGPAITKVECEEHAAENEEDVDPLAEDGEGFCEGGHVECEDDF